MRKKIFWTDRRREAAVGLLFAAPEACGILLLGVFPLLFSLYISFCKWNLIGGISSLKFAGLANYAEMFHDDLFYVALKNNLIFSLAVVPAGLVIALVLSVLIHDKVYGKDFFKAALFIPYVSTTVAIAAVWGALFHPSLGPINQTLKHLGVEHPPKWLADPHYALFAIIIIVIWANLGYKIIIYLAGLGNISVELYEAARMDGAGQVQQFWRITVPLLGPTIFFLSITTLIASFKVFDLVRFLTDGGPNYSTNVLVYYLYEQGFVNFRMGYASALSWALFVIVGVLTAITWAVQHRKVHY